MTLTTQESKPDHIATVEQARDSIHSVYSFYSHSALKHINAALGHLAYAWEYAKGEEADPTRALDERIVEEEQTCKKQP